MDNAIIGLLFVIGVFHLLLIIIPIITTLRAAISRTSKLAWCVFLIALPFFGVAIFHFRFRSSLFLGKSYEPTPHDLGVRVDKHSPDRRD